MNRQAKRLIATSNTKSPAVMLEVAEQWLHEASLLLTELKHPDLSMQLTRVAHECASCRRGM